jgi:DNA-binding transcriptional LysR family regulator
MGVEMTAAGKAMMALCEDMLEAARMVPHQIAQATRRVEGIVRIQIISGLVSPEFDEAIASFHRRHPAIHIEIRVSPWRGVLDSLEQGEVEIGVGYDSSVRGSLMYEPLLVERQQLYCSRTSPYFGRHITRLGELKDERFVLTGEDEIELITHLRRRYRLGTKIGGVAEDINEARRLILHGVGIGFLPILAAETEAAKGRLWPLLHADFEPKYDIFLLARSEPARDTATQLFWDEVIRRLRAKQRS